MAICSVTFVLTHIALMPIMTLFFGVARSASYFQNSIAFSTFAHIEKAAFFIRSRFAFWHTWSHFLMMRAQMMIPH